MIYLRLIVVLVIFLIASLAMLPMLWLARRTGVISPRLFPSFFGRLLCSMLGLRVRTFNAVHWRAPALIVPNHVSWCDIIILAAAGQGCFLAKKEVGRWPVVGMWARLQGVIFIDRERKRSILSANTEIAASLGRDQAVILFAEGTTNDGTLLKPFRSSHFEAVRQHLAAAGEPALPVIPVAIHYARRNGLPLSRTDRASIAWYGDLDLLPHLIEMLRYGAIDCRIVVGEPILAGRDMARKQLTRKVEKAVRQIWQQDRDMAGL